MQDHVVTAPGAPGITPRWTSSAKVVVGTALGGASRVWFTVSHGILNEVYYPRLDQACLRDAGFIVADGESFFSEEKRHTTSEISFPADGVPAVRLRNQCTQGRYRIDKEIIADPRRDVVLQRVRMTALTGDPLQLYLLAAPHLHNCGAGNSAWVGEYKGVPMLFAERDGTALALACSVPWRKRSVGFAGTSDGWQDIQQHHRMQWSWTRAEDGNVALAAEVDWQAAPDGFVVALGFGSSAGEAGHRARASLNDCALGGFDALRDAYIEAWQGWLDALQPLERVAPAAQDRFRRSVAVLRVHEAKSFRGGMIASLSIPWGFAKGDEDLGGYHLVWPRDLVETAGGLLAAGAHRDARRVLGYLQATQEADGHWAQNTWMDGTPYWQGLQMDETALPILLVDLARRCGALEAADLERFWPMVRRAAAFVVQNGPVTQEDRWEEDPGYSPFTLAAEIAGLLAAADLADQAGDTAAADYLRATADTWNDAVERWTYVTDTDLSRRLGVEGYYVRIAPPDVADAASPKGGFVPIKNRPWGDSQQPAAQLVSPDALALVRFGLRRADDPRMRNTVQVIDALLRMQTPVGPAWHRYNDDGYGEHDDGSAFNGTGTGRLWPLLTGERAHYELARGHADEAARLLATFEAFANDGGMLPEQVWDAPDIAARELYFGRPSGSAMPLVWAHAEHVKLMRSLALGRVFDQPPQPVARYIEQTTTSPYAVWRFNHKCRTLAAGKILRLETLAPARVHWSADGWHSVRDSSSRDTDLGVFVVDLPTDQLRPGEAVAFTFYWTDVQRWEGTDFSMRVVSAAEM